MSHFDSMSRRNGRDAGGDGVVTLNDWIGKKNSLQMSVNVPAKPTDEPSQSSPDDKYLIKAHSPQQIQAEEVREALTFRDSKKKEVMDVYDWLDWSVNAGILIIAVIAVANAVRKVGTVNIAVDPWLNGIAVAGVIGGLIIGPVILFFLKKGMKAGAFNGLSLVAAWVAMLIIVGDETGGLYSMFDPSFTETYFHLAAFTIPVILTLAFMVVLLKPDMRRKRQLVRLQETERHEIAAGAIKERRKKAKAEERARQMGQIASTAARWKFVFMSMIAAVLRGWSDVRRAGFTSVMNEADAVAKNVGAKTKSRGGASKKGRRS